jgi:hypothetical protein
MSRRNERFSKDWFERWIGMDMNGMVDRCMNAVGAMMGGTIGNGAMLVVLLVLFLAWLIGLGVVGALIFWGVKRQAHIPARPPEGGGHTKSRGVDKDLAR